MINSIDELAHGKYLSGDKFCKWLQDNGLIPGVTMGKLIIDVPEDGSGPVSVYVQIPLSKEILSIKPPESKPAVVMVGEKEVDA